MRWLDRANTLGTIATNQANPHALAADATGVYWIADPGELRRSTNGKVETLASGFSTAPDKMNRARHHKVALTSKYVVWLTGSEVLRLEK